VVQPAQLALQRGQGALLLLLLQLLHLLLILITPPATAVIAIGAMITPLLPCCGCGCRCGAACARLPGATARA
jgi:hypothetical protein